MAKKKTIVEPTIHDKYRKYIDMAKSGYLRGHSYPEIIEMLRYCEKKLNRQIPINLQCSQCLIDLVMMFARLENN